TSAHRKEELFAPFGFSKQCRRNYIHIEERSMIRHQQNWPAMIDGLDIFQPIHEHQIVTGKMNPARAENTLAPGPESFPPALIHAMRDAESEALEGSKDCEFFDGGYKRPFRHVGF